MLSNSVAHCNKTYKLTLLFSNKIDCCSTFAACKILHLRSITGLDVHQGLKIEEIDVYRAFKVYPEIVVNLVIKMPVLINQRVTASPFQIYVDFMKNRYNFDGVFRATLLWSCPFITKVSSLKYIISVKRSCVTQTKNSSRPYGRTLYIQRGRIST